MFNQNSPDNTMEATLTNKSITANTQTAKKSIETTETYKKSDSKEFLSGVFYIIKKVFLLG